MRSCSSGKPPSDPNDGFTLGPLIYQDNTDDVNTTRSTRRRAGANHSPVPEEADPLTFRSPSKTPAKLRSIPYPFHKTYVRDDRQRILARRSGESSKRSYSQEPKRRQKRYDTSDEEERVERSDAELRREKSDYEKRKREKIIELAKKAEQDHDKLLVQRTLAEQTTKEIESSMAIEQDVRNRSMDMMKKQLDGMDWRSNRDLKDVRKEIQQWKEKTAMSGELAARVDKVEQRVDALEKNDAERKKTIDLVEKNWADFGRLKTQSMALEITQINNRRGAMHRAAMPKDMAETTARNLYKLCADLHRLTFHLNHKSDLTRLVDEALTLAEAIAPLYGPKEDFIDSRENTSSTNVSLSAQTSSSADPSSASSSVSGSSAPTSPSSPNSSSRAPIRSSLRRVGRDPAAVSIPPLSKFDPKYSARENLFIDAPSLREKSSNYYSDKEFSNLAKDQTSCEPVAVVPQVEPTVTPPATPAAPANLPTTPVVVPADLPPPPAAESAAAAAASEPPAAAPPKEVPPKEESAEGLEGHAAPAAATELPAAAPVAAPAVAPAAEAAPAPPLPPCPASVSSSVDSEKGGSQEKTETKNPQ